MLLSVVNIYSGFECLFLEECVHVSVWSVANEFCKVFLGKNSERIVTGFKAYLYDPGTQSLSIIS